MRLKYSWLAGLVGWALTVGGVGLPVVMGQAVSGGGVSPPPAVVPTAQPASKVIPELNVEQTRIEDVVDYLRDRDPNFKVIVTREPADSRGPLVTLKLKNVTGPDVLQMLQAAYPNQAALVAPGGPYPLPTTVVTVQPIAGEGGETMYAVKIVNLPGANEPPNQRQVEERIRRQQSVMVYNLRPIVTALALSQPDPTAPATEPAHFDADYHKAMNDTLSLIKTVLDMLPDHDAPGADIRVHVETGTLIVKGTEEQQRAVGEAMRALDNPDAPGAASFQPMRGRRGPGPGFGGGGPPGAQ